MKKLETMTVGRKDQRSVKMSDGKLIEVDGLSPDVAYKIYEQLSKEKQQSLRVMKKGDFRKEIGAVYFTDLDELIVSDQTVDRPESIKDNPLLEVNTNHGNLEMNDFEDVGKMPADVQEVTMPDDRKVQIYGGLTRTEAERIYNHWSLEDMQNKIEYIGQVRSLSDGVETIYDVEMNKVIVGKKKEKFSSVIKVNDRLAELQLEDIREIRKWSEKSRGVDFHDR
ncbi:MAG: hypothetical protein GY786_03875, partial [Proteobacteria bacterium]|nr:hypothetical protein [Pseudomonadota bacterium]